MQDRFCISAGEDMSLRACRAKAFSQPALFGCSYRVFHFVRTLTHCNVPPNPACGCTFGGGDSCPSQPSSSVIGISTLRQL